MFFGVNFFEKINDLILKVLLIIARFLKMLQDEFPDQIMFTAETSNQAIFNFSLEGFDQFFSQIRPESDDFLS